MTGDTMLTAERRGRELEGAVAAPVDVLVVGGGITGAGVALDAASRGLSVVLVEKTDLAAGTSRWSSKLAHGGLRYISAGQVGVAYESAVERNHLARTIAPHLIQPLPFLLPMLPSYPPGARAVSKGLLAAADALAFAARTPSWLPRNRWADRGELDRLAPALAREVKGAYVHVDGSLEDDARLVVGVARTAAGFGARILTHCAAVEVSRDGARVRDELTGTSYDVRARAVVVAGGVWSGHLVGGVPLRPSRGSHLLLRADAVGSPSVAFNVVVPGTVNRFVFLVPRPDGTVQLGLTDDAVDAIDDEPAVTAADERFLLETASTGLDRPVTSAAVIGRFAGLRPLLASGDGDSTADISRRHALLERDGVHVIVGGKLTTYRRMAQDAVDAVASRLGVRTPCRTTALPLVGAVGAAAPLAGIEPVAAARLRRRFGAEAAAVAACGPAQPLAPGVPVLACEAGWAVAAEGAVTADDVVRRLRLDLVPAWRDAALPALAGLT